MRPLCILLAGEPVPATLSSRGTFGALIREAIGPAWSGETLELDLLRGEPLRIENFAGLVITGSASSVTERAPWMLGAEELLRSAVDARVPVLGLCFGHQLLGQALGGRVDKSPRGREMGTVALDVLVDDPLIGPSGRRVMVNTTHVDSVVELPPSAVVLASTALEPNAAVRFGERAWGVQFHPELDAGVMRHYIEARRDVLESEGTNASALLDAASDTPESAGLLARFVDIVRGD
jgi:GMP synthase (glutamine-hydrolysing)